MRPPARTPPPSGVPSARDLSTCAWCPKLCRHVCPVAVGSSREAAAPSNMALHPLRYLESQGSLDLALGAADLCVDCGACTAHCDLDRPLGQLLTAFRLELRAPPPARPVGSIEGDGQLVAIETDDRPWATALAARLGRPVARLRTADHLGAAHLAHPHAGSAHADALRQALGQRTVVVADHRSFEAARRAGLAVKHLVELVAVTGDGPVHHPCRGPRLPGDSAPDALACCGAVEALPTRHPQTAQAVAQAAARRLAEHAGDHPVRTPDCTCSQALRQGGLSVIDPIDSLLSPQS